ncbi:MAG: restriction endonuclease subunit S [Chloroflexi bacterium]|nr:restriction endonuclease subunit S [Chloroflexota bacterium]
MTTVAKEAAAGRIGKWVPYPAYRDSGVEWLGEIPAHWEVKPLKVGVHSPVEKGVDENLPFVALEHVQSGAGRLVSDFEWCEVGANDYAIFLENDVLCGKLRPYLRKYWRCDRRGCCPTELLVLRPRREQITGDFLFYLVQSNPFVSLADATSYGVKMPRTSWDVLGPSPMWFPPVGEQRAIAAFLDREMAQIDAITAKKERLIALLEEKRAALISHAVTKGLDPTAPMKDSGIPWLGEIPARWEIRRLKTLAAIRYGLGEPPRPMPDGLPLLRATNVERGKINPNGLMFVDPDDVPYSRNPELITDDIIVVRSGAYTGDSAIIPEQYNGAVAGYDMVVRAKVGLARFLAYGLLSVNIKKNQIDLCRLRAAQPHLNKEELGDCLFFVPPIDEQKTIVARLNRECEVFESLIQKSLDQIAKLQEYRTALISAAVTGKIDVREG